MNEYGVVTMNRGGEIRRANKFMKRVISFSIRFDRFCSVNLNSNKIVENFSYLHIYYLLYLLYILSYLLFTSFFVIQKKKLYLVDRELKNRIYERGVKVIVVRVVF